MLKLREALRINELYSILISRFLISFMMVAFMVTIIQFGQRIDPTWRGEYLPGFCLIVSLEVLFSRRATRISRGSNPQLLYYRLAEIVLILIVFKLFLYFLHGFDQFSVDLGLWQKDFFNTFFSGEYLIGACLIFIVWLISGLYAVNLVGLEGDEVLLGNEVSGNKDLGYEVQRNEVPKDAVNERIFARDRIMELTFGLGLVNVFLAGFVRLDWRSAWGNRPPLQTGGWNVIIYFLFAFALLSQTQFAILRGRWAWERIQPNRNIAIRWALYGFIFLLILTGITLVLPVRFSIGLLAIFSYIFDLLVSLMVATWGIFIFIFSTLLTILGKGGKNPEIPKVVVPKLPELPQSPIVITQPIPWFEFLKSVFFWIIFIGIIGLSIYQYLKQNREIVEKLRQFWGVIWIEKAWGWVRAAFLKANQSINIIVQSSIQHLRQVIIKQKPEKEWRYLNPRHLTPRQRIMFFYLALIHRAINTGIPRDPSQTPYEYENNLCSALPEVMDELSGLTNAFVEIRYSPHPGSKEQAKQVQNWWAQIRRKLKRIK